MGGLLGKVDILQSLPHLLGIILNALDVDKLRLIQGHLDDTSSSL